MTNSESLTMQLETGGTQSHGGCLTQASTGKPEGYVLRYSWDAMALMQSHVPAGIMCSLVTVSLKRRGERRRGEVFGGS
jgi:hypothetical protein